ncbi:MAG: NAD-dependent epimerase/dehydratase family protein, partial [Clostridia bacterium]|nr:NAD-dependent epimerase/dehydratase family protein [Clostridia bacterium]
MTELLITGASGFVGTAVTEYLAGSDIHTMGVSLRNGIPADLDLSAFDAVLHAAGIAHVDAGKTDPHEYDRATHLMTIELA